jgi:hypothetical protein
MTDLSELHRLVVAHEAREDGQTGGVCRGPARGSQRVRGEVEDRAAAGGPPRAAIDGAGIEQLVELPVVAIDHENVPVAGRAGAAFDRRIRWKRVRAAVTFRVVGERHGDLRLRSGYDDIGNAIRRAVPHRAEIRVQSTIAATGDERR